ncbi:amino acid adenylation domain-containing protein [Photorhabdus caribbeanensis]|nr:amino acid adenylation domain-containing protein [Photorhabdus caribbeanensis]MBS9425545.1 amino acid adenylation domain-containing protein [Photorhabdus caribbeanensis]
MPVNYNIVALSPMQEGMLYHSIEEGGKDVYVTNFTLTIAGLIDEKKLDIAWNRVVSEHQALRTVYRWKGLSHPVQIIFENKPLNIDFRTFENNRYREVQENINEIVSQKTEIDLEHCPIKINLYKVSEDNYILHVQYHHICMDGWSLGLLITQLWDYYDHPQLECVGKIFDYEDYIVHLNKVKQCNEAKGFWTGVISQDAAISLPSKQNLLSKGVGKVECTLDKNLINEVELYCKGNGFTLAIAIYAAWSTVLSKYNDAESICFGTTVSGRDNLIPGIENSIGLYIQTPPLLVDNLSGQTTLLSIMKRVQTSILDRDAYKEYPISEIQSVNKIKHNLFDSIVVIENYPISRRLQELSASVDILSYTTSETTNFDLSLEVNLLDSAILKLSYNSEKYQEYFINGILKQFTRVLKALAYNAEKTLSELCFLDEREYNQLVIDFNNNDVPLPGPAHLTFAWQAAVEKYQGDIAIRQQGTRVTYAELDELSNQIAKGLYAKGVKHQELVAVKCRASIHTIALLIAINKLGAAYVPINISTPEERVNKILSNGIKHIIYHDDLLSLSEVKEGDSQRPSLAYSENDLVYTIFTSGSTGEPKGVMLEHHTVMNYIYWAMSSYHAEGYRSVYPLFTSLAFDLTVTSIWCPLISGGEIEIIDKQSFEALQDVAKNQSLSNVKITPSQLNLLNQICDNKSSLQTFILGGEQLESKLCKEITDKLKPGVTIFNEYGPTEATVGCMIYRYQQDQQENPVVPIGRPINNAKIYILDKNLHPQPIGVPGEIYIGGSVLARGYLNRPDLTAEKFIDNPFDHQSKLYKTGDLAFFNGDGDVEYIGRVDNQIKLRGYRIELDEIATKIKSYDGCRNAVVVIKKIHGEDQLVAYYISDQDIAENNLRRYVSESLPSYMVPGIFKAVDEIRLTTNGKVDLASLPDLDLTSPNIVDLERSSYKDKVIEVFSSILEIDQIDLKTSFFDLGANSIKLLRITNVLNEFLPFPLKVVDFFTYTNMATLISYIESGEKQEINLVNKEESMSRRDRLAERRGKMKKRVSFVN